MIKKIVALVLFLVLGKLSYSQYPMQQNLGNDSTIIVSKGALQSRLVNVTFTDTTQANTQRIRQYPGAQIATTSGGIKLWLRNQTATAWIPINVGSGNNIYTIDGTLTGDRTLTGGGNSLTFTGVSGLSLSADSIINTAAVQRFLAGNQSFGLRGDTAFLARRLSYNSNLGSTFTAYSLVDKNYVDSLVNNNVLGIANYVPKFDGTNSIDTSQIYQNNGAIGIGTTSPAAKLQVTGNTYVNGQFAAGDTVPGTYFIQGTGFLPSVLGRKAVTNTLSGDPRTAGVVGTTIARGEVANRLMGGAFYVLSDSNNTQNISQLRAGQAWTIHNGTGTITNAWGDYNVVTNNRTGIITNAYGSVSGVENNSTGVVNKLHGQSVEVWNNRGGSIDTAFGQTVSIYNNNAASTIGAVYGVSIGKGMITNTGGTHYWRNSGTINNSYGLYLDTSIDVGINKYAIYSFSRSNSYFNGNIGIGTTSPAAKLDVIDSTKTTLKAVNFQTSGWAVDATAYGYDNGAGRFLQIDTLPANNNYPLTIERRLRDSTNRLEMGTGFVINMQKDNKATTNAVVFTTKIKDSTAANFSADLAIRNRVNNVMSTNLYISGAGNVGVQNTSPDSSLSVTNGALFQRGVRMSGLPSAPGTKALRINSNGTLSVADTLIDAGGTVTSVATNNGTGITGGTITTSGTLAIDTTIISTRAWRQKGVDSLQANINQKLNISDTASMLSPYLRSNTAAATYVPQTRTLTINGTTQDLSANRTYNVGTVTSVGLTMPAAFNVAGSPVTGSGTLAVTGAGLASQYIRGDGTLANFPGGGGGGGSSVSYYLNGSVNQGTFGGNTYYQMSKNALTSTSADFTIGTNGYIAQFITDAGDPSLLNIPAGNWNFEVYFSASSAGGNPQFYIDLYKYNGSSFTLIASGSSSPESITGGTVKDLYISSLAVPSTSLTLTDRLAVRIYIIHDGRTITLYTQNGNLCQIITTFTTGITALNSLTAQVQYLTTGTSGTDFNISSLTDTHTFNLPVASATNTGKLSNTDWSTFNNKVNISDTASMLSPYVNNVGYGLLKSGQVVRADSATLSNYYLRRKDSLTSTNLLGYVTRKVLADTAAAIRSADAGGTVTSVATNNGTGITGGTITTTGTLAIDTLRISTRAWRQKGIDSVQANLTAGLATKLNISDTAAMLSPYARTNVVNAALATKLNISDTATMLSPYLRKVDTTAMLSPYKTFYPRTAISLTTTGSSGAATYNNSTGVLNIPVYTDAFTGTVTSVATNNGTGITGGTITTTGTLAIDTLLVSTRAWRQKGVDSVASLINTRVSGTTNYIPKFTSSSAIGNSQIFDNGTQIGYGTTSPVGFASDDIVFQINNSASTGSSRSMLRLTNGYSGTTWGNGAFLGIDNNLNFYLYNYENNSLLFGTNSTERMRLDASGNLGLGTTSTSSISGGYTGFFINGSTGSNIDLRGGGTGYGRVQADANGLLFAGLNSVPITFFTSGSERMRLDASGNLGLGVTPSAWGSTFKSFDESAGNLASFSTSELYLTQGGYNNSGWKYTATGFASQYLQVNGQHRWNIAASGTAGNAISFTQAMTLDVSGRLGIGTTSPLVPLHVETSGTSTSAFANVVTSLRSKAAGRDVTLQFSDNTNATYIGSQGSELYFGTNGTNERMRITSGGAVGINTSSPDAGMALTLRESSTLSGALALINRNNTKRFDLIIDVNSVDDGAFGIYDRTAGAYRQVITSGGNVGIGTSAPTAYTGYTTLALNNATFGGALDFMSNGTIVGQIANNASNFFIESRSTFPIVFSAGGSERMRITSGGNILIGTTTDGGYKLDVNGTGRFTANNAALTVTSASSTGYSSTTYQADSRTYVTGVGGSAAGVTETRNSYYIYDNTAALVRFSIASTGAATFSSSVTATSFFESSSIKLKNVVKRDGDVAYFKWKDNNDGGLTHIGYIAEEVQKNNPDQVRMAENGFLSVNYIEILVEKVRKLEKEIEALKNKK